MDSIGFVSLAKMCSCDLSVTPVKTSISLRFCFSAFYILISLAAVLLVMSEMGGFAAFS